ncbi:phosphate signaling complex protein PhoU [Aciduricibacillus chroicocephali]|uniref:Phosphate-specific transport system accessory protein PhoU n=1 Tax=Aciduricibacillus chroicocephali TaxID=3054939 RepID=A0ABY9KS92_9BACI|nr:phosphate signaling complex protein PhoU [Bacillaceae bacterium 44XB]
MTARSVFAADLEKVNNQIIKLGEAAINALADAVGALAMRNTELAKSVIEHDLVIDRIELDINNQAFLLMARQQPVATDLRRLVTALKIASDLERMGDNAKNIAQTALKLRSDSPLALHPSILKMERKAIEMAKLAIKAFTNEDAALAMQFCVMDDEIDSSYETIVQELFAEQILDEGELQHALHMAFCARYIERFADHVTNIAEAVVFLVKGENCQLN